MTGQFFSVKEALAVGWQTTKKHFWFFVILLLTVGLINAAPSLLDQFFPGAGPALMISSKFVLWVLSTVAGMGLIRISLKLSRSEAAEFADLFSCFSLIFKYFLASLLYGLIVLGGLILLVVPGLIWAVTFQYYSYFVIDQELGPGEALRKSAAITQGARWDLFKLDFIIMLLYVIGTIPLMLGLFVTIPVSMLALAHVYRELLARHETMQLPPQPPPPDDFSI